MADVTINSLGRETTLTVTVRMARQFHVRLWLATQLFKLAAVVLDCNVVIEEPKD